MNNILRAGLIFNLVAIVIMLFPARDIFAQTALLQGTFQRLQQFIVPESKHAQQSDSDADIRLEQLKEEAADIELQISTLKKEQLHAFLKGIPDIHRLSSQQINEKLGQLRTELDRWLHKQEVSEEASVKLNRDRLMLQQTLEDHTDISNRHIAEKQALLYQQLHNLTLKIRLTERFQAFSKPQIQLLLSEIKQLESVSIPSSTWFQYD